MIENGQIKNEIVVGMITKDSLTSRGTTFVETLQAIKREIPFEYFILDDNSKITETEKIIKTIHNIMGEKKLIITRGGSTRAIARQNVINEFLKLKRKWLLFVDDDSILNEGWYDEARQHLEEDAVGLIWGINWDATNDRRLWLQKLFGRDFKEYLIEQFWLRGGMHDTLLKREAIENIKIPSFLHIYEDYWILKHVENNGYKIKILDRGVIHKNPVGSMSRENLLLTAKLDKSLNMQSSGLLTIVKAFMSLPLNVFNSIKVGKGLKRGIKRWYEKIMYRVLLFFLSRYEIDDRYKQTRKERKLVSTWARRFLKWRDQV